MRRPVGVAAADGSVVLHASDLRPGFMLNGHPLIEVTVAWRPVDSFVDVSYRSDVYGEWVTRRFKADELVELRS